MAGKNYLRFVLFCAYVEDSTLCGRLSKMDLAIKLLTSHLPSSNSEVVQRQGGYHGKEVRRQPWQGGKEAMRISWQGDREKTLARRQGSDRSEKARGGYRCEEVRKRR